MNNQPRDDLPNQIHMVLCAIIPLSIIILLHSFLGLPRGLSAVIGILSGVISIFAAAPLTIAIYRTIAKIKYGKVPEDAVVHTTDAGCSSLIFVILILILYPVLSDAKDRREKNLKRQTDDEKAVRQKVEE